MMNTKFITIVLLSFVLITNACVKDEIDNDKPNIEIIRPKNHDEYKLGDTIFMKIKFTDNKELKSVSLQLMADGALTPEIEIKKELSQNVFEIDTFFIIWRDDPFDIDLSLEAFDKSGNVRSKLQHSHCNGS